jgi:hypothetical protein
VRFACSEAFFPGAERASAKAEPPSHGGGTRSNPVCAFPGCMGKPSWLNHASHACRMCRDCSRRAYLGAYLRSCRMWQQEPGAGSDSGKRAADRVLSRPRLGGRPRGTVRRVGRRWVLLSILARRQRGKLRRPAAFRPRVGHDLTDPPRASIPPQEPGSRRLGARQERT